MRANITVIQSTCSDLLASLSDASVQLIVTDPPWNTGGIRKMASGEYFDRYSDLEYQKMITNLLVEAHRVLTPEGSLAIWTNFRWNPYVCVWGDEVFGRKNRVGEIICHSELGNPGKKKWPIKHSNVALFARDAKKQTFNVTALPRVLRAGSYSKNTVSAHRAGNSVLRATMTQLDAQRTSYPDQKLLAVYRVFVEALSLPGQTVVDPFAGSGTLGAATSGRVVILGDTNAQAVCVMRDRFA